MNNLPAPLHPVATAAKALLLAVRAVFAAGVGVVVLAGLPYGLIRYIGWPLPHRPPSIARLKLDLTSPILNDEVYLNALAIVLWFLWLLLTVSFAAELTALLRRAERPRLPALSPFQALAFVLLTAIGLTALMARTATPARAAAFSTAPSRDTPFAVSAPVRPGPAVDTTATAPSLADPAETVHVVVPGDTLYHIAQEDYDDAEDWPVLAELNKGVLQPDGQRLTDPNLILPGWRLITTTEQTTAPPAAPSAARGTSTAPAPPSSSPPHPTVSNTSQPTPTTTEEKPTSPPERTVTPNRAPDPSQHHATPAAAPVDWIDLAAGGALAATVLTALGLALARARRHRRWYADCYWPRPSETQGPVTLAVPAALRPAPGHSPAEQDTDEELDEFGAPLKTPMSAPHGADRTVVERGEEKPVAGEAGPESSLHGESVVRIPAAATPERIIALQDIDPLLALTGPGALGAARAIAAAVLSCREYHPAGAHLLIARQDAAVLIERPEAELPDYVPGITCLELASTPGQAIDALEHYLAYRADLLRERDLDNLDELSEQDLEYHPALVLLAVARPGHTGRLQSALKAAAPLHAHAVLLGPHPTAFTWHIDANQHIDGLTAPAGARAFDLSADGLQATLNLLEHAAGHGEQAEPPCPPDPDAELAAPVWQPDPPAAEPTARRPDNNQQSDDSQPDPAAEQPARRPSWPASRPQLLAPDADLDKDNVARIMDDYAQRPVRVDVLGIRAITTPTGTVDSGLRQDAWRLITRLAVHHRTSHSAEDLAVLWPDHDDTALRRSLRNALYDLRATLKQRCGDTGGNPARYIQQRNRRYSLNQQFVGIDLLTFTQLRSLAASVRDSTQRAAAARAALELYHGELLAGQDEEWILAPRAAARRDALATATLLAQLADQHGDPEIALTWWERALQIDDNEEVYRQVIQLQARMGRRADAMATRDLLIARLDADQLSPAPTTLAVLADALGHRPAPRSGVGSEKS